MKDDRTATIASGSHWIASADVPSFAALDQHVSADVAVVGGGVTGLTAAYLLALAGRSVVVLERGRLAEGDTGHTTAHLTMVTDMPLSELARRFGSREAQEVWAAGRAALSRIESIVDEEYIECGFETVDGFLHAPLEAAEAPKDEERFLRNEAIVARELGADAEFVEKVPVVNRLGVRYSRQARFHPRRYLAGLASALVRNGARIYEQSPVRKYSESPLTVTANGFNVSCADIVIATHNPVAGISSHANANFLQTKLALYTTYALAAAVPRGTVTDGLFWELADPYHYLRLDPGPEHDIVIFGGEDHKTGQVGDTEARYARLERTLSKLIPAAARPHRWSGQVIETPDGLPFIGSTAPHQYVATGFSGNGFTFGTVGALICADQILGTPNRWAELFSVERKVIVRGLWEYLRENSDYPYYLIRSRLPGGDGRSLRSMGLGEGRIIEHDGQRIAVYRDPSGGLILRSATCPHMGCEVGWNAADRTWDCPCHGSRFAPDGSVLGGPAESPLGRLESQ